MGMQIVLNSIIAVVWIFLQNEWSLSQFLIGYAAGIGCIVLLRRFWPQGLYLGKAWAFAKLLLLFNKELLLSSWAVLRHIVRPQLSIRPGIVAIPTELETDWEITALSCLICLTPGTLTLDVSHDRRTLYVHAMDIEDAELLSRQIKDSFEKAIMEVTR
ncbi:Na+/H+ antiporter subunit E [Paenibacillus sp. y28]|uniref:Na+/H+ antiporter subunit E n=1 Tax=Paenibacillus sp. y28 TaxID=3129110 RepID=UPI0030185009